MAHQGLSHDTDYYHIHQHQFHSDLPAPSKKSFENELKLSNICSSQASQLAKILPDLHLILSMCHYCYVLKLKKSQLNTFAFMYEKISIYHDDDTDMNDKV